MRTAVLAAIALAAVIPNATDLREVFPSLVYQALR
jgi:hypothetical protein